MTTVMAFGTFDLLHPGHEYFLNQAKKQGDCLIVVIARDATVKEVKGRMPTQKETERLKAVRGLNLADKAVLGCVNNKYAVISRYRPDIIVLGYDQVNFVDKLAEKIKDIKLSAKIVRLRAFKPNLYKTSIIKHGNHN